MNDPALPTRSLPPAGPAPETAVPQIEGYQVVDRLGEGGMGVVWRAVQLSTKREVALKVIGAGAIGSRRTQLRFEREVELTARLDHPHIARVYDSGVHQGVYFYAAELVAGGVPLDEYAARAGLGPRQVIELVGPVCAAVQHAHQRGVIHRDLKPSNILVTAAGHPYVLDFGLAKPTGPGAAEAIALTLSTDGHVAGTPAFMSPEQAAGARGGVDTRTDVYSLGVILYRLLTGDDPHDLSGSLADVLRRIGSTDVRRPRTVRPTLDRDLEAVLLKALGRRVQDRYQSVSELAADLERYLRGDPVTAQRQTAMYWFAKGLRKHRGRAAAVAAALVLVVAAVLLHSDRVRRERNAAVAARHDAELARAGEAEQRHAAEVQLAHSVASEGNALGAAGRWAAAEARYREARDRLAGAGESTIRVDAGTWDAYRHNPPPLCDYTHGASTPALAFSPDGRTFASNKADRGLVICELATGREVRQLFPPPGVARDVAFTPDGRRLLSGEADGRLRLWDVATGDLLQELRGHVGEVRAVAIARDGRAAVSAGWDGTVRLWELDSGRAVAILKGHDGVVWGVALSPDGRLALSGGQDRTVRLWDLTSQQPLAVWQGPGVYYGVLFSPDGRYAMAGDGGHKLSVWDVQTRELVRTFQGHASPVGSVAITAAGDRVVTGSADNTVKVWEFPSGRLLRTIDGQRFVTKVALSADDRLVLSGGLDGSVTLHALDASADAPAFAGHTTWVSTVALSPDLRVAASGDAAGLVILWDLATGRELRRPSTGGGAVHCVQFSPDGASLLIAGAGLTVVDVSDGRVLHRFEGNPGGLYRAGFSPDGLRVIGAGPDAVRIWDANTGRVLAKIQGPPQPAFGVSFLPDGTRAFAGYRDGTLLIADAASGKALYDVRQKGFMVGAWLAPDGRTALANLDRAPGIDVWDLPSGVRSRVLMGHTSLVHTAVFGADSRHAVSGCMDYTLRLWDVATGAELYCFEGHRNAVTMVAASPDLRLIVSVGHDLVARVWDLRRPGRSDTLRAAAARARAVLAERPSDAASLAALGEWYAFRGVDDWAVTYLEKARGQGASVSALTLARCYWRLDRLKDASREFGRAFDQTTEPRERAYLQLCEQAVRRGS